MSDSVKKSSVSLAHQRWKSFDTFLVCILDLIQPISTALSAASNPSGVETLFIVNRTVFWIAFPSRIKHFLINSLAFYSTSDKSMGGEMISWSARRTHLHERWPRLPCYVLELAKIMLPRIHESQEKTITKSPWLKTFTCIRDLQVSL